MREKKRYLLVRGKNLRENVRRAVLEFVGVRGMSKACLNFIEEKYPKGHEKDCAIVSVDRKAVELVRASLVVAPEKMEVLKVSGTIKGLGKK